MSICVIPGPKYLTLSIYLATSSLLFILVIGHKYLVYDENNIFLSFILSMQLQYDKVTILKIINIGITLKNLVGLI